MRYCIPQPLPDSQDALMQRAGYVRHCVEAGRTCYHRSISAHRFPRFHALVSLASGDMEIDLHFDQYDFKGKSNHQDSWAYEGGRVTGELNRLIETIKNPKKNRQVNRSSQCSITERVAKPKQKRSIFEILFK
jgi:hypothetical protein